MTPSYKLLFNKHDASGLCYYFVWAIQFGLTDCEAQTAGITCQFSSSHRNPDEQTLKCTQGQQGSDTTDKQNGVSQLQSAAVATASAAVHTEVPSGPSVELANPSNGTAAQTADHKSQQPVAEHITG